MLRFVEPMTHPDLLVGLETGDDAAVWRRPGGRALVATVDFFAPVVDDARTWGAIAASNSASDVYAMGGRPLFALNVAAWPRDVLPLDLLGAVLDGARSAARDGGWIVAGGHTVDGPEPMFGQVVIGEVEESDILTNVGARVGDALVLTKALGTGIITTALKRGPAEAASPEGPLSLAYGAAVASMCRLNAEAAGAATAAGAHAATDVTGFGLLGHLHKMLVGSQVGAVIETAAVPVLPQVFDLLDGGASPGGTDRNLDFVRAAVRVEAASGAWSRWHRVLADPQTSGGLLFSCRPDAATTAVAQLRAAGNDAAVIGEVVAATSEDPPGTIRVR